MVAAIRVHQVGGPEVLTYEDIEIGAPGEGQIRMKQHACGVNFSDVYFRKGTYPAPTAFPFVAGSEGAGEVTAVGPGVADLKVGDRIAYTHPFNGYAAERLVPANRVVMMPSSITFEQAAGMMLKGMTAEFLLRRTFKVQQGHTVLIHAAAGGVGQIACQWAKHLGATVIGTVGLKEKAKLAEKNGCDYTILYREDDFVARVKDATKGALCDVVYDGVGKATFLASLDCLRPLGMCVSFGSASGPIEPFSLSLLTQKGSLFTTRPALNAYISKREDLVQSANALFSVVTSGAVKIPVNQTYKLKDAQHAHRDLEARATTGSSILLP